MIPFYRFQMASSQGLLLFLRLICTFCHRNMFISGERESRRQRIWVTQDHGHEHLQMNEVNLTKYETN